MGKAKGVYIPPEFAGVYEWQEKVLRVDRVPDLAVYHKKKARFLSSQLGRKFLKYRLERAGTFRGLKVWYVDGYALRNGLKDGDVDFTMGGHGYRYLYIPRNEIWIDIVYKSSGDNLPTLWHELFYERRFMRLGMSYSKAHDLASEMEIAYRHGHVTLPVGTHRLRISCGPAALKPYLEYLGRNLSEKSLAQLCKTGAHGTNPVDLADAVRGLGFRVKHRGIPLSENAFRNLWKEIVGEGIDPPDPTPSTRELFRRLKNKKGWTVRAVKDSISNGYPVLANFQIAHKYGEGHYALIIGYTQDTFILSDSWGKCWRVRENKGYREVNIQEFMDLWYELEDRTVREGFVIY